MNTHTEVAIDGLPAFPAMALALVAVTTSGLDLVARDRKSRCVIAIADELPKAGGAGDVGPLADVYKNRPHASSKASSPESLSAGERVGIWRGFFPATACAMWRMWSGVVPQQPPRMLTRPLFAHSSS